MSNNTTTTMKRKDKDIRISRENWETLTKLAAKSETYDHVLTRILEQLKELEQ